MICKLCHSEEKLQNSHVISEFLFKPLYNDENKFMGVTGVGNKGWRPLQKGLREKLFCTGCEGLLNDKYEKPFYKEWIVSNKLPNPFNFDHPIIVSVDYRSFKLFHLSILFRASVSTLPTFSKVNLGLHQEIIREMLLNNNPGNYWQYPIIGIVVRHNKNNSIPPIITMPFQGRLLGHVFYSIVYAGVEWNIFVSSHRNADIEDAALASSGRIVLDSIRWHENGVIRNAANLFQEL